jgi:Threonine aldolase
MQKLSPEAKSALRARCTKFLSFDRRRSAAEWVAAMASSPHLHLELDSYSHGPAITQLENIVAGLLGKEAALWFPKGIVAQQAALLVHAAETGSKIVGIHPKSHLAIDEAGAIERLAGLTALRVGTDHRHFGLADLQKISEPLGSVILELPLRRAGYQAVPWDDLVAIADWARQSQVRFHLDGARLWEVQPWYGRSLADIAALADTVYVSLYKGLGGLSGCILAGSATTIEAVKPWRLRFGGDLPIGFPLIITALDGLQKTLPRMGRYHETACALAAAIEGVAGLTVFPSPPHCNSFQVHFQASAEAMEQAAMDMAKERGEWLFGWFEQGLLPDTSMGEITIGEASLDWTPADAAAALTELDRRARAHRPTTSIARE